jgi:hypothetical protein
MYVEVLQKDAWSHIHITNLIFPVWCIYIPRSIISYGYGVTTVMEMRPCTTPNIHHIKLKWQGILNAINEWKSKVYTQIIFGNYYLIY